MALGVPVEHDRAALECRERLPEVLDGLLLLLGEVLVAHVLSLLPLALRVLADTLQIGSQVGGPHNGSELVEGDLAIGGLRDTPHQACEALQLHRLAEALKRRIVLAQEGSNLGCLNGASALGVELLEEALS